MHRLYRLLEQRPIQPGCRHDSPLAVVVRRGAAFQGRELGRQFAVMGAEALAEGVCGMDIGLQSPGNVLKPLRLKTGRFVQLSQKLQQPDLIKSQML